MNETAINDKTLKDVVKLGQSIGDPKVVNGIPYVVIPTDSKLESLERFLQTEYAERPSRKKGTVTVVDAVSFVEYYTLFSDENSRIFADESTSAVLAVLDYHGIGDNAPRWGGHRLKLTLRHSEEWKEWIGHNGKKMTQMEFAEFIEQNTPDIADPPAATMLEMARDLSAKSDIEFGSAVRTSNGQVQLRYSETVKGTYGAGNIDIPEEFLLSIPVYIGTERVPLRARLRYRIAQGKITIWYDLLRHEDTARKAFLRVRTQIQESLKANIINGTPGN